MRHNPFSIPSLESNDLLIVHDKISLKFLVHNHTKCACSSAFVPSDYLNKAFSDPFVPARTHPNPN